MKNIEKILKYIFGEMHFLKIKNFFEQFYNKDNFDFVIFTTRRCHVLFCIFNRYFFDSYDSNGITFISDKALHFYNNKLKGSKCAIVDDILIHGRALNSVYDRVYSKRPESVKKYAFMQSKEAKHKADIVVYDCVSNAIWKRFSNRIVTAIIMASFPYTSYIFSCYNFINKLEFDNKILELKDLFPCLPIKLSLNEVDNNNELNKLLSEYIECYMFDISEYSNKFGLDFSCLRLYYNKYLECCVVIPYCITRKMTSPDIDKILDEYFCQDKKIQNVEKYETKYRAITSLYSFGLLHYLKQELSLDYLSWSNNSDNINMSYYDSFFDEINGILESNKLKKIVTDLNTENFIFDNFSSHKSNSDSPLENDVYSTTFERYFNGQINNDTFYDTLETNDKLSKWFYSYLIEVHFAEEQLFNNSTPQKQLGLSFEMFSTLFKKNEPYFSTNNITSFDFYSKIISCADSGFLSIFADYYFYNTNGKKNKLYSNFLITGEHVCRLFQNKYLIFVLELLKSYEKFNKCFIPRSKYSSSGVFDKLYEITEGLEGYEDSVILKNIINNIRSAYDFITNSPNKIFIEKNIYDDFNDEYLYRLFDLGTAIISESDEN